MSFLISGLRTGLQAFLVALISALLLVMSAQIILRYGFNSSLLWSEELCRYFLIWIAFLAGIFAYERGEIAAVTLLANALPRTGAFAVIIVGGILSAMLCLVLTYYGFIYAKLAGGQQIPAIRFILEDLFGPAAPEAPTVFWVYAALPVGIGLVGLRICLDIVRHARAFRNGQMPADTGLPGPESGLHQ